MKIKNDDQLQNIAPESLWLRRVLEQEFAKRCSKNRAYSLRAFARFLGMEASSLSQIMRGSRNASRKKTLELSRKLGVTPTPLLSPTPEQDERAVNINSLNLTADAFAVIGEWYHYGLLQMFGLKNFICEPQVIAKKLGVTPTEVQTALFRLERLGMIEVCEQKKYKLITDQVTTVNNDFTNAAFKKFQRQLLEMALNALDDVPFERRDQTAMTFRFNPSRMQEAREKIKKFRRDFCAEFETDPECTEVYTLSTSFFPMSLKS